MGSIEFTCKDPLIAAYCDEKFGEEFGDQWATKRTAGGREGALRAFRRRLRHEAKQQEWFDYTEADGIRTVIHDHNDKPTLLIPEVVVIS